MVSLLWTKALMELTGKPRGEIIRFINIPRKKRIESVRRHREWQKKLDKERFFNEVFGK